MSDSEYESDYDSEYDSEYEGSSEYTEETEGTEATCTSLEAALAEMTARLAELDGGLDSMAATTATLEQPVTSVAISAFTNPRVLECAPFRSTKFRLKHDAKMALGTPHHTVSFTELCAAVRKTLAIKGDVLGATKFLEVLQRLSDIVE
jgi:hypothetical protein